MTTLFALELLTWNNACLRIQDVMMAVAKRNIHYILNKSENPSSKLFAFYLQNETSEKSNESVSEFSKTGLLQNFNKSLDLSQVLSH